MDLLGCAKGMVTAWGVAGEGLDAEHAERGWLSSDLGGEPSLCRGSWAVPPAWGPWPGRGGPCRLPLGLALARPGLAASPAKQRQ